MCLKDRDQQWCIWVRKKQRQGFTHSTCIVLNTKGNSFICSAQPVAYFLQNNKLMNMWSEGSLRKERSQFLQILLERLFEPKLNLKLSPKASRARVLVHWPVLESWKAQGLRGVAKLSCLPPSQPQYTEMQRWSHIYKLIYCCLLVWLCQSYKYTKCNAFQTHKLSSCEIDAGFGWVVLGFLFSG